QSSPCSPEPPPRPRRAGPGCVANSRIAALHDETDAPTPRTLPSSALLHFIERSVGEFGEPCGGDAAGRGEVRGQASPRLPRQRSPGPVRTPATQAIVTAATRSHPARDPNQLQKPIQDLVSLDLTGSDCTASPSRSTGPRPRPGSTNATSAGVSVKHRISSSVPMSGYDRSRSIWSSGNNRVAIDYSYATGRTAVNVAENITTTIVDPA